MVMFSNSIANPGVNNLQVRLGDIITNPDQTLIDYLESLGLDVDSVRLASQELLDANKNIAVVIRKFRTIFDVFLIFIHFSSLMFNSADATLSNYHRSHNHIHVTETARFSLEHFDNSTAEWGVVSGRSALKQYFCLMDTDQIRPVNGSSDPDYYERHNDGTTSYNGCSESLQGVSNGGMDYYGAGLPDQQVNICGLAAGIYRIIVTLNPSGWFIESNYSNNVGWASFELERDNEGLPTVSEIPESKGGIWFEEVNWPPFEPTKSPSPTATFSPSKCTGNTPNWVDMWFDEGCDWFEENDLPGCPYYGNYGNEESGTAMDNCCYCKLSQSPTNSPYPTYYTTPYPQYPTFEPTKSPSPTATFSPSMCTGNTPNWVDMWLGVGCDWYEENDLPGCPFYGNSYDGGNGTAMDNCCYCALSQSPTNSPHPTNSPSPTYSGSTYPPTVEICSAELLTAKPTQRVRKRENSLFFRTGSCSRLFMRISLYSINATFSIHYKQGKSTKEPSTLKPTTMKPSTLNPTTMKPSTLKPTTMKPSTMKPTTMKPSTVKPTTKKPTPKPTSSKPSTTKPSTKKQSSSKPTSKKPSPKPTMNRVFT